MSIVANGSDSTFSYTALNGSGETSLDAYTFDLYVDGSLVGSSISFIIQDDESTIALGRFGVNTYSTAIGADFMIDNLESYTSVPEPAESAAILAALALLLGLAIRRRKHS